MGMGDESAQLKIQKPAGVGTVGATSAAAKAGAQLPKAGGMTPSKLLSTPEPIKPAAAAQGLPGLVPGGMGGGMGGMGAMGAMKPNGKGAGKPGCKWCEKGECWDH